MIKFKNILAFFKSFLWVWIIVGIFYESYTLLMIAVVGEATRIESNPLIAWSEFGMFAIAFGYLTFYVVRYAIPSNIKEFYTNERRLKLNGVIGEKKGTI